MMGCVRATPEVKHPFDPDTSPSTSPPTTTEDAEIDVGPTRAVNDRDFLLPALHVIEAASERIRIAEYLLYDDSPVDEIVVELLDAVERGVRVQVLADEEGPDTATVLASLEAGGVETQLDSNQVVLHNKLVIADDVVLVGSHNFTDAAMERNHEGTVLIDDGEVAAWYATWYDAMWEDPAPNPQMPAWSRTDLVPLADRMITDALLGCIEQADEDIELLIYAVAWNNAYPGSDVDLLLTALEEAHIRGVEVDVIVDGSFWIIENAINDDAISRLDDAGIPVWRTPASVTTHAKVLRCDEMVVVSDANWSYSGLEVMHGTSLMATTTSLVADYREWMRPIREDANPI